MKRLGIVAIGVVALAIVVFLSLRADGSRKRARVYVDEAEKGAIAHAVKATGEVRPRIEVNISTHVVAKIARLHVREGDLVAARAPFLDLERDAFLAVRDTAAAQLAINRSELRQAEVSLSDAEVRLARARRLTGEGITPAEQFEVSELQYDSALLRLEQARSAVEQARAGLAKAQDDLGKTTIYAPLTGRVISLNAKEGEVVVSGTMNNPASVIGTIADLSEILVEADVDENEVVHIHAGQGATVHVDALADRSFVGTVVEIGSSGFSRAQQPDVTYFKVKVLLSEPDERLRAGMSARVEIEVERRTDAVVVPIQAVVHRPPTARTEGTAGATGGTSPAPASSATAKDEEAVVFVVVDGRARQKPVETGISDTTRVEIRRGLEIREQVVTGPYRALKKLRDGDRVKVASRLEDEEKADRGRGNEEKE